MLIPFLIHEESSSFADKIILTAVQHLIALSGSHHQFGFPKRKTAAGYAAAVS
jgi:hypothetical protein